jgi:tetratricopeptide (TPR) repeat protein
MRPLLHIAVRVHRFVARKRSHKALALMFVAIALSSLALSVRPEVSAQTNGAASAAQTEDEAEAYRLYREEQLIGARTKAEAALERNPDSLVGHYVLGAVLHEAEGSLARAMFHLGRARELYETTWIASSRPDGAPWELHRDILYQIQGLAGEMELYDYQLEIQGYHDYLYDPDLLAEHAWPLIGLGRYDEAREFAVRATKARRDPWMRSAGLNALCAVEGEAGLRGEWLEACLAALANAHERRGTEDEGALTVHAFNAAQAARSTLDFQQAEVLALAGARRLEFTPANPWRLLAQQYLDQARMTDAAAALREMQRWRRRQPAFLRDQDRAETDVIFAIVMLVAGETEMAERAVLRAIEQPDRRGLTSSSAEQALGAHALLRRAIARTHGEREAEQAAFGGVLGRVSGSAGRIALDFHVMGDEERIRSALADDRRLLHTMRQYVNGGLEPLPPWLVGDLVEVLGAGVVAVGVRLARAVEGPTSPLVPYYDGLDAEVALSRGDEDEAYDLAARALGALPTTEALLRARLSVVAAEAARQRGQNTERVAYLADALATDGGAIRRMRLSIPARVRVSGSSSIGAEVAAMIERSPRFTDDPGFEVRVSDEGVSIKACLLTAEGAQIRCATVDPAALERQHQEALEAWEAERAARQERGATEAGADEQADVEAEEDEDEAEPPEPIDPAEHLATEFHDVVFGAAVSLSSADMSSLDGRTTTGADVAREQMQNLLQQAMEPPP